MHICYKVGFGLAGCYLDDSHGSAQRYASRRELADDIRYSLDFYGFPKSAFGEVGIRRLWGLIINAKSASSYTFHIHHGAHVLTYYGMTEREEMEERASDGDADDREEAKAWLEAAN